MIVMKSPSGSEQMASDQAMKKLCELFSVPFILALKSVSKTSIVFYDARGHPEQVEMSGTEEEMRLPVRLAGVYLLAEEHRKAVSGAQREAPPIKTPLSMQEVEKIKQTLDLVYSTRIEPAYRIRLASYAFMGLISVDDLQHAALCDDMPRVFTAIEFMKVEKIPFRQALASLS